MISLGRVGRACALQRLCGRLRPTEGPGNRGPSGQGKLDGLPSLMEEGVARSVRGAGDLVSAIISTTAFGRCGA